MSPGLLLLAAAGCLASGIAAGPRLPRAWLALTLAGTGAALGAGLLVLGGAGEWEWRAALLVGGEPLHLRLDGLSAIFLVLASVVGGVGATYAREYWSDAHHASSAPRGRAWWCALVLAMGLVLTQSNGLHFLLAWEAFAVSAWFLITLERERVAVRKAGWLYLAMSHAGTLCLFGFFALLASRTGSWDLGPLREVAGLAPLLWLALIGFGIKAGAFPLHAWLPSAHASAPSHVSAIMSGVAIKMGVYGLFRFTGWLPAPRALGWTLVGIGAVSALLGIAFAFVQDDLKRLLAYCSVENIGIIFTGLGLALIGAKQGHAPWGSLALAAALLHVWNHGAFKSLLFLGAGSVLHGTGTREMRRLGGLWRTMPWTAGLFALGAVAVAGLPPLNGFVSEWLLYLSLFDVTLGRGAAAWAAVPAAILLAVAGALALATFAKAAGIVLLGAPRSQAAMNARESGPLMRGSMLVMAAACVALGLAPLAFWPAIARAVGAWAPAWGGAVAPAPLASLGVAQVVVAVAACVGVAALRRKTTAAGIERAPTWDCGYAAPSARMQYTSGSFAGIVAGWFAWIVRPDRRIRRVRGPLPAAALRVESIPDTVLEHVLVPAAGVVLRAAAAVRALQRGRLQAYILYVVVGLAAVAGLVLGRATP